jgi:hypothetical protein
MFDPNKECKIRINYALGGAVQILLIAVKAI